MAYPVARRLTRVSGHFGPREPIPLGDGRWSPAFHGGVDFTPNVKGSRIPAYAVGAGTVYGINLGSGAAGLNVMIRLDSDGSLWWYGHLSRVDVVKGQRVRDGQQVGLIGATGNTTGVHLHLERHWPRIDVETDPWPYIKDARDIDGNTSSWQTGNPPVATGDAGSTPTAEQIEEEELMGAKEDIIAAVQEHVTAELSTLTSRMRREARPEVYFIRQDARGSYDAASAPYAAAVHPASGFIFPLQRPDRSGQIASLAANYRLTAFDSVPQGFTEHAFWNGIKDVLIGSGRLPVDTTEAAGVAAARDLFAHVAPS